MKNTLIVTGGKTSKEFIKKIINEQPDNLERGLALGNQSSQWFALYYLDKIDRLIKEELQIKSYVRYMDGATV